MNMFVCKQLDKLSLFNVHKYTKNTKKEEFPSLKLKLKVFRILAKAKGFLCFNSQANRIINIILSYRSVPKKNSPCIDVGKEPFMYVCSIY